MKYQIVGLTLGAFVCVAPSAVMGASVQALLNTCAGATSTPLQDETGAWSEAASGPDTENCTTGTGGFGGDVQAVQSNIFANAVSSQNGVTNSSTLGVNAFSTQSYVLEALGGSSLSRVSLTVTGQLTGSYDLRVSKSSTSVGAQASAVIGGSLYIGTVNSQDGYQESARTGTDSIPINTTFIEQGVVDEILSASSFVTPGTPFDIRAGAYSFGVGLARLDTFGEGASQAQSTVSAALSYTFGIIPDGYCLINISTEASSCDDNGGGGGGGNGGPTDPVAPVPLPAGGLFLLGGLAILTRLRKGA